MPARPAEQSAQGCRDTLPEGGDWERGALCGDCRDGGRSLRRLPGRLPLCHLHACVRNVLARTLVPPRNNELREVAGYMHARMLTGAFWESRREQA